MSPNRPLKLLPFDIVFAQGKTWIGRSIRWATTLPGKQAPAINHVAFIIAPGSLQTAVIQEALIEPPRAVIRHPMGVYAQSQEPVVIYRPLNLTDEDIVNMYRKAEETLGRGYNYGGIALQLIDALLSKLAQRPIRFARRLTVSKWQICAQNVAEVWNEAGLSFGVESGTATPDDIYDFVIANDEKYALIYPLNPVPFVF